MFDFGAELDLGSRRKPTEWVVVANLPLDPPKQKRRKGPKRKNKPAEEHHKQVRSESSTSNAKHGLSKQQQLLQNGMLHYIDDDRLNLMFEPRDNSVKSLSKENGEGNVEYKLRLKDPNPIRLQQLITQMKFRLSEGNGVCYYYIGVEDHGYPKGLEAKDLEASISTLHGMAQSLQASAMLVKYLPAAHGRQCALLRVTRNCIEDVCYTDLRIAVAGSVDSGKSTLVAVLTHGGGGRPLLDNGRGTARMNVFRHKHEIESGRTSSISQQLLGYDAEGRVLNYVGVSTLTPAEISCVASKLCHFIDMGGHEKYLKTALYGMTCLLPDYALLCVCASSGLSRITCEHLAVAVALEVPVAVVLTKVDLVDAAALQVLVQDLRSLLALALPGLQPQPCGQPDLEAVAPIVTSEAEAVACAEVLSMMHAANLQDRGAACIPVFPVSCVAGMGLSVLHAFLQKLQPLGRQQQQPQLYQDGTTRCSQAAQQAASSAAAVHISAASSGCLISLPGHLQQHRHQHQQDSMHPGITGSNSQYAEDAPVHFQVDQTFEVDGVGSVVSGTLVQGTIHLGQQLVLGPTQEHTFLPVTVTCIQRSHNPVRSIKPGQNATVALQAHCEVALGAAAAATAPPAAAAAAVGATAMRLAHRGGGLKDGMSCIGPAAAAAAADADAATAVKHTQNTEMADASTRVLSFDDALDAAAESLGLSLGLDDDGDGGGSDAGGSDDMSFAVHNMDFDKRCACQRNMQPLHMMCTQSTASHTLSKGTRSIPCCEQAGIGDKAAQVVVGSNICSYNSCLEQYKGIIGSDEQYDASRASTAQHSTGDSAAMSLAGSVMSLMSYASEQEALAGDTSVDTTAPSDAMQTLSRFTASNGTGICSPIARAGSASTHSSQDMELNWTGVFPSAAAVASDSAQQVNHAANAEPCDQHRADCKKQQQQQQQQRHAPGPKVRRRQLQRQQRRAQAAAAAAAAAAPSDSPVHCGMPFEDTAYRIHQIQLGSGSRSSCSRLQQHDMDWEACQLATSPPASFLACSPPNSRKGAVLLDAAISPRTLWGFEAVLVLLGGHWPPRGLVSGHWPTEPNERMNISGTSGNSSSSYSDREGSAQVAPAAAGAAPAPAAAGVPYGTAAAVSAEVVPGAVTLRRGSSGRSSKTKSGLAAEYITVVHCGSVRQAARVVSMQEVSSDADHKAGTSQRIDLQLSRSICAAAAVLHSPWGNHASSAYSNAADWDALDTNPDLGCIVKVGFRFMHRPEWLKEGARLIIRDRSDGHVAGAGFVTQLSEGT